MIGPIDLSNLREEELATLLGVNPCTIRRWHKSNGLPSHGKRETKRFDWAKVREWHLDYRVRVALHGGAQAGTITSEISEIKRAAAEKATSEAQAGFDARLERLKRAHRDQLSKLRDEVQRHKPVRLRRR